MDERARAARAEYQRRYRKEHPEKVRQWQENYWIKKAAKVSPIGGEADERAKESA